MNEYLVTDFVRCPGTDFPGPLCPLSSHKPFGINRERVIKTVPIRLDSRNIKK